MRSYTTLKPVGKPINDGFYSKSLNAEAGDSLQMIKEFLQWKWKWLQLRWNWMPTFIEP
jgi:hypothetical protein